MDIFSFSPDEPMTNLQLKVSASLKQALDKLKLSSENEEKKGKDIRKLSRYVILTVRQINYFCCCCLFLRQLFDKVINVLSNLGNNFPSVEL